MSQLNSDHNQSSSTATFTSTATTSASAPATTNTTTTTTTTATIDTFAFLSQPMADYGCSIIDVPPAQLQQQLEKFEDPTTFGSYLQDLTSFTSPVENYPNTTMMSTMELLHYSLPTAPEPTPLTGAEMTVPLFKEDPDMFTTMSSQQHPQQQLYQPPVVVAVPSSSTYHAKAVSLSSLLKHFPDFTKFIGHDYCGNFVQLWFSFQKCILLARHAEYRTWVTRELCSITEHLDLTVEKIMDERKQMAPQHHQHEDCEQQTPFLICAIQSLKERVEVMHHVMLIIETARIQYNQDPVNAIMPILHRIIEKRQEEKQQHQQQFSGQQQGQQVSDMMLLMADNAVNSSSSSSNVGGTTTTTTTTFMQQDHQHQQGSIFIDPTVFVQQQMQLQQEFYQNPAMAAMMMQNNNNNNNRGVYCVHPSALMQPWPTPTASPGGYAVMSPTPSPEHHQQQYQQQQQQQQLLFRMDNNGDFKTSTTMSSLSSSCSLPPPQHEAIAYLPSPAASTPTHGAAIAYQPPTPPDTFFAIKAEQQQQQQQHDLQHELSALQISVDTKGQQYYRHHHNLRQKEEIDNNKKKIKQEQGSSALSVIAATVDDGDEIDDEEHVNDDDDGDADYCEEEEEDGETESDDEEMEDADDEDDDDYVEPSSSSSAAAAAARRRRSNNNNRSTTLKIEPSLSSSRATIKKPGVQPQQQVRRPRAPRTYTRRTATSYDAETTHYLKSVFFSIYSKKDKLTKEQRKQVQTHTGLKPRNITYWFSNHKRRFQNSLYVFKQTVRQSQGKVKTYDDFLMWRRQHGLPEDVLDNEVADGAIIDEGCWSSSSSPSTNSIKNEDEEEEDQKQQNSDSGISCSPSPAVVATAAQ